MKYELKKIENSAVEIKINLTAEELTPIKNEVLKEIAEKVEIPGFRKGHAPMSKVEASFGDKIKEEVVEVVLKANYDKIIADEKIIPVSYIYDLAITMKDAFEVTFKVDVYPEVTLGEYKGLEVEKETFEMTDEMLNKEIENILNSKSKLEDAEEGHKAEMGDTLDLAFDGSIDGVQFDGGKSDSHKLKLGSKMFIDTFEDQLVGYVVGQEGEIKVKFPEEYHVETLAGKPAVFKVKINAIQKLSTPELTEELAKEMGYDSIEDLKAKTKEEVKTREEGRIKNSFIGKLIQKIVSASKIDIPKSMIVQEVEHRLAEMGQQLSMQGLNLEQYFKMTGMSKEQAYDQIAPMAENKIKSEMALGEIVKAENIQINDEELNTKFEEVAKMYGMTKEKLEEELNKNKSYDLFLTNLKNEISAEKAIDIIINNSK